jgi:hypothetical protein
MAFRLEHVEEFREWRRLICETLGWPTCAAVINLNGEFVELLMKIRTKSLHEIDAKAKLVCGKQRKSFSFCMIRASSIDGNDKQSICGDGSVRSTT